MNVEHTVGHGLRVFLVRAFIETENMHFWVRTPKGVRHSVSRCFRLEVNLRLRVQRVWDAFPVGKDQDFNSS